MYYEIGVLDSFTHDEIHKYVTEAKMYKQKVVDNVSSLIHRIHGDDVIIAWNEMEGDMPKDVDSIIPDVKEDKLNYIK
jgi:hypothetical protein